MHCIRSEFLAEVAKPLFFILCVFGGISSGYKTNDREKPYWKNKKSQGGTLC